MLQAIIKIIVSIMLAISSFIIVRNLLASKQKLSNFYILINVLLIGLPSFILYKPEYSYILSITSFLIAIFVYKNIFKISIRTSLAICSIMFAIIALSDIVITSSELAFFTSSQIRENSYIFLFNNLIIFMLSICISRIHWLKVKINKFLNIVSVDNHISSVIFAILIVVIICLLFYSISSTFDLSIPIPFVLSVIVFVVFLVLYYFYMEERNNYEKLNDEYNSLFNYVQEFENWIDDEQLYRHELKNNLSMIRSLTKNKKIIDKIDDMLHFSIIVDESYIEDLKNIPKGGLKGLLYYKLATSKNANVKTIVEVSPKCTSKIKKLSRDNLKQLGILLGIYLDNAIEAAKDSKKRLVTLEVYTLKDEINFVISNTFKELVKIKDLNKKGYTTKGDGHGRGLYYAQKVISRNKNFSSSQMILNDFFVQKLSIK